MIWPLNMKSTCGTEPMVEEAEISSRSDCPNVRRKWFGGSGEGSSEALARRLPLYLNFSWVLFRSWSNSPTFFTDVRMSGALALLRSTATASL